MEKIFDVPDGLPELDFRKAPWGNVQINRHRKGHRQVFNHLYGAAQNFGGLFELDSSGAISISDLPEGVIEEEQVGFLVESRFEPIHPKHPETGLTMRIFSVGALYQHHPRDLRIISAKGVRPDDHGTQWQFLLDFANHLATHPYHPVTTPISRPSPAEVVRLNSEGDDIMARISGLLD